MGIAPQQAPVTVNNGQPTPPIAPDKNDGNFIIDIKPNAPLGMYTVVMKATTPIQFVKDPNTKKQLPVTVVGASTPITFKVLPLSVAKITATPKGNFKGGVDGEITVKVERQFEYTGEFKVKLILPMGTKGITAADVTIPAGKDEVVIPVKVAGDVAAGNLQNVAVQATAMVEGTVPTLHEVKFNVTVEKAPPPKREEPKKVDPKKEEPKKVEPKKVDPKKEEPKKK
jgi:subtilisin-like proprotein convertase family protein